MSLLIIVFTPYFVSNFSLGFLLIIIVFVNKLYKMILETKKDIFNVFV